MAASVKNRDRGTHITDIKDRHSHTHNTHSNTGQVIGFNQELCAGVYPYACTLIAPFNCYLTVAPQHLFPKPCVPYFFTDCLHPDICPPYSPAPRRLRKAARRCRTHAASRQPWSNPIIGKYLVSMLAGAAARMHARGVSTAEAGCNRGHLRKAPPQTDGKGLKVAEDRRRHGGQKGAPSEGPRRSREFEIQIVGKDRHLHTRNWACAPSGGPRSTGAPRGGSRSAAAARA
jgi:hypothetical protein